MKTDIEQDERDDYNAYVSKISVYESQVEAELRRWKWAQEAGLTWKEYGDKMLKIQEVI